MATNPRSIGESASAQSALRHWQAGEHAAAEAMARALLERQPDDLLALNLLAAAALRRGALGEAIRWAERAIAIAPCDHRAHNTRGVAARAGGDLEAAEAAYRRALALAPDDPAVAANLGNLLLAGGRLEEALSLFAHALRADPGAGAARAGLSSARTRLMQRAVELHNAGASAEAARLYRHVLEACPEDTEALLFLAKAERREGHLDRAEEILARRLARARDAAALEELGRLRRAQGRWTEALEALESALGSRPDDGPLWHEHAAVALAAGRPDRAIVSAERAVELQPHELECRVTLSAALQAAGRLQAALDVLAEARPLRPRPAIDAWLAATLSLAGQLGRIEERERAVAELHPLLDDPAEVERLRRTLDPGTGMRLAFLLQFTGCTDERRWAFLRLLAERIDPHPRPRPRALAGEPVRRIRVGYLSPNLGEHPTGHLLAPILEAHDRDRFELFVWSTADRSRDPGPYPARLRAAAEHWRDLHGLDDGAVAAAIERDRPHVLVDLGGYLAGGRPGVLARRPAPIQFHWIMHLSGMPAAFVDATLVDATMVPVDHPARSHGPLVRLPDAFQPGYRQPVAAEPPSRAACDLPADGPVLCAFNNPLKIDAGVLDAWCAILRAVPDASLWLGPTPDGLPLEPLRAAAARRGVAAERLRFAERLADRAAHLARQHHALLYLDTFAFGGATSAMDALLAGLPVLTCRGDQAYGRIGASFATVLGLPELVAADPASYVHRAIELLRDPAQLATLRDRVAHAVANGPLFDATRFTRALEAVFLEAWEAFARDGVHEPASAHRPA